MNHVCCETALLPKRTLPSAMPVITPPGCVLLAVTCQLLQPQQPMPMDGLSWQPWTSSQPLYETFGVGVSMRPLPAEMLAPDWPIAQVPRMSLAFQPMRSSSIRMVVEVPSDSVCSLVPPLTTMAPPPLQPAVHEG